MSKYIHLTDDEAAAVVARRGGARSDSVNLPKVDPAKVLPLTDGEYAFILRRRSGKSLRDVAEALGVSAVTVGKRERGLKGDPKSLIRYLEKEVNDAVPEDPSAPASGPGAQ